MKSIDELLAPMQKRLDAATPVVKISSVPNDILEKLPLGIGIITSYSNADFIDYRTDIERLIRAIKRADERLGEECYCVPTGNDVCDICQARREIRAILEPK